MVCTADGSCVSLADIEVGWLLLLERSLIVNSLLRAIRGVLLFHLQP